MIRYQKTLLNFFQIVFKNKLSLTILDAFQLVLLKPYIYFENFIKKFVFKTFQISN